MSQRMINTLNTTSSISKPEVGEDAAKVEFDGQSYQFSSNPFDKRVLPNGAVVRENVKLDNSASGINVPTDQEARS